MFWGGCWLFDLFYFHRCSDQTSVLFWGINLWCLVSPCAAVNYSNGEERQKREILFWHCCPCEHRGQWTEETRVTEGKRRKHQNEECNVTWASVWRTTKQNNKRDDYLFKKHIVSQNQLRLSGEMFLSTRLTWGWKFGFISVHLHVMDATTLSEIMQVSLFQRQKCLYLSLRSSRWNLLLLIIIMIMNLVIQNTLKAKEHLTGVCRQINWY